MAKDSKRSDHEYVEWPRPDYLPADATLPANYPCKVCCKPRGEHALLAALAEEKP